MQATAPPPLPRLLRAAEVAEQFGVRKDRVYAWTREGLLPSIRFGRTVRYDLNEVREFLRAGGTTTPNP